MPDQDLKAGLRDLVRDAGAAQPPSWVPAWLRDLSNWTTRGTQASMADISAMTQAMQAHMGLPRQPMTDRDFAILFSLGMNPGAIRDARLPESLMGKPVVGEVNRPLAPAEATSPSPQAVVEEPGASQTQVWNNPLLRAAEMVSRLGSRDAAVAEAMAAALRDPSDEFYRSVLWHLQSGRPLPAVLSGGSLPGGGPR